MARATDVERRRHERSSALSLLLRIGEEGSPSELSSLLIQCVGKEYGLTVVRKKGEHAVITYEFEILLPPQRGIARRATTGSRLDFN